MLIWAYGLGWSFRGSGLGLVAARSPFSTLVVVVASAGYIWQQARTAGRLRLLHRDPKQRALAGYLLPSSFTLPQPQSSSYLICSLTWPVGPPLLVLLRRLLSRSPSLFRYSLATIVAIAWP